MDSSPPVALTIAGSDSSSGAGLQADLKTFAAHGVYGLNAVTAVVAEVPCQVAMIEPVLGTLLSSQIECVTGHFPVGATKTGMLATEANVKIVASFFEDKLNCPLVVDPVMVATVGTELLSATGMRAMKSRLLPLAALATPNIPEAEVLLNAKLDSPASIAAAPKQLHEAYGCSFLVKGGHTSGGDEIVDFGWIEGQAREFPHRRLEISTHGTGCTLSAAITAQLALGTSLSEAVPVGIEYIGRALSAHFSWTGGETSIEALNHFPDDLQ